MKPYGRSLTLAIVLAGCGQEPQGGAEVVETPSVEPVPVQLLRNSVTATARGDRAVTLHVYLPPAVTQSAAQVTLQGVIDSVAAADTLAAEVRVTGFVLGTYDPATGEADLVPAIAAAWIPRDSVPATGSARASRYRTHFVVLRPFPEPAAQGDESRHER